MVTRILRCRVASCLLSLLTFGAPLVPAVQAGQVRVNVGSGGSFFTPYAVNINEGDHVVWVWLSGSHTVTSWTLPADSVNFSADGAIFDSGGSPFGLSNQRFAWKSDRTGHVPYVCVPHIVDVMSG